MKFFAPAFLSLVLATVNVTAQAQDSVRRAPAQRPPATTTPATVAQPVAPAKPRVSLWTQLQSAKDSLKAEQAKSAQAQAALARQTDTIQLLQDSLKAKAEVAAEIPQEAGDQVSVLGSHVSFSTYNTVVLGALALAILALVIVVVRSAQYRHEAHYRTSLFQELSDEFQAHKVKANEKEKKLARELQDERNKLEELKGR